MIPRWRHRRARQCRERDDEWVDAGPDRKEAIESAHRYPGQEGHDYGQHSRHAVGLHQSRGDDGGEASDTADRKVHAAGGDHNHLGEGDDDRQRDVVDQCVEVEFGEEVGLRHAQDDCHQAHDTEESQPGGPLSGSERRRQGGHAGTAFFSFTTLLRPTTTVRARSSSTASSSTRPVTNWTQKLGMLSRLSPFSIVPMSSPPRSVPKT